MKDIFKILLWVVIAAVIVLLLRIFLFPLFIANKVVDTAEGVVSKTLNADNVIFNYEMFHDLNQGVKAAEANIRAQDKKITDRKATYGADATKWPKDVRVAMDFDNETRSGYVTQYNRLASDYNANSRKLNRNLFKEKNLPYEIPLWSE